MRIYDPRLGRFLSVDPLTNKFPWFTPYQFAGNMPIWAIDLDGAEPEIQTLAFLERKFLGTNYIQRTQNGFIERMQKTVNDLYHSIKDAFLSQPITTALGGDGYVKNGYGETYSPTYLNETSFEGKGVKEVASLMVNGFAEEYGGLIKKAAKGNPEAIGAIGFELTVFFIGFPEFKAAGFAEKAAVRTKGFAFFQESEKTFMSEAARNFESGTVGAMSSMNKKKIVPGLFYKNPNSNGSNFIKLDGFEIVGSDLVLVDAKLSLGGWSKQINSLKRLSKALAENPTFGKLNIRGVIEFPNEAALNRANSILRKNNITNIETRLRTN